MAEFADIVERAKRLARSSADTVKSTVRDQLAGYDLADEQNRYLSDVNKVQNARESESSARDAYNEKVNARLAIGGALGGGLLGGAAQSLQSAFERANRVDLAKIYDSLQLNNDNVDNNEQNSKNVNNVQRANAITTGKGNLQNLQTELAADLANIDDSFWDPNIGSGDTDLGVSDLPTAPAALKARVSGYVMPDMYRENIQKKAAANRTPVAGDYFSRLFR